MVCTRKRLALWVVSGGAFAVEPQIATKTPFELQQLLSADLDSDGDIDLILRSESNEVWWLENVDGEGTFDTFRSIAAPSPPDPTVANSDADSLHGVYDLDQDGDLDILAARGNQILWFESDHADTANANLDEDGTVGFADLLIMSANFEKTDAAFSDGDRDENKTADFAAFLLLSKNFGLRH